MNETPLTSARAMYLAMPVAGCMIAHQIAAKAVRDAAFLNAWPVSALPLMVIASAVVVIATVPVFSRLLELAGPRIVVSIGFLVSAFGHGVEYRVAGFSPWVAVAIYLHVMCFSGLLLSGFWSVVSELFDPKTAKRAYGRIAATGTVGGLIGGLAAAQIAATMPDRSALLLLAGLHACCAVGVVAMGGSLSLRRPAEQTEGRAGHQFFRFDFFRGARHLKTLSVIVILGAASAAIIDFALKVQVTTRFGAGGNLLEFFARYYVVVQLATVLAQLSVGVAIRRFGLGTTMSALPASVGAMGTLALLSPSFPILITARGVEAVLRGSLFRSAYELIFVPMDPVERSRTKTFLDVTCDRLGDALGAGTVQAALFVAALTGSAAYVSTQLLVVVIGMAAGTLWLAGRLDALYLGVVERRLTTHRDADPIVVGSEAGWTLLDLSAVQGADRTRAVDKQPSTPSTAERDPTIVRLSDLRSGDRGRVGRALDRLTHPDAVDVAVIIQLLAWDDVVARARQVLERVGARNVGLLTDALLDASTDFAIRRRVPRILGGLPDPRAVLGLMAGLDDTRFEVRFQCGRALNRLISHYPELSVDRAQVMAIVEREVSVPPHIWSGHRLIDHLEPEDDAGTSTPATETRAQRNLEHVFSLLSVVLPPEPLTVALRGMESTDPSLRGVAIEYLESVLPSVIWIKFRALLDADAVVRAGKGPESPGSH